MATKARRAPRGVIAAALLRLHGPTAAEIPPKVVRFPRADFIRARPGQPIPRLRGRALPGGPGPPRPIGLEFYLKNPTDAARQAEEREAVFSHKPTFGRFRQDIVVRDFRTNTAYGLVPEPARKHMQRRHADGKKFVGRVVRIEIENSRTHVIVRMWES